MANTCPGFSETGSLSNIRFPLSQENSWNSQALGTDALDRTMVPRRGHCSLRTPFPTWQGLGAGQAGDPGDGREGNHFYDWRMAWGGVGGCWTQGESTEKGIAPPSPQPGFLGSIRSMPCEADMLPAPVLLGEGSGRIPGRWPGKSSSMIKG